MSLEFKEFNSLPHGEQADIAGLIAAYTHGQLDEEPQMLPVDSADILDRHLGYVALKSGTFSGYIGAMHILAHKGLNMAEVGSLWVPKNSRHQGIAHKLIGLASGSLVAIQEVPYAFCNPLSKGIFTQMGYHEVDAQQVPPEALVACNSCPMKPANGDCCDDILIFRGGR